MDKLPDSLLVEILSRLDNSADVARCRAASKALDDVSPCLGSINLRCSSKWFSNSSSGRFKRIFLDLILKLETVESVSIRGYDSYLTDVDFAKEWMPRVSKSLKSLSLSGYNFISRIDIPNVVPMISSYCHNLVNLKLMFAWFSTHNLIPLPMLTTLTLEYTKLQDQHINRFNKCFPNLQHLNLTLISGFVNPMIHHLNLKTCHLSLCDYLCSLTLVTPNLISLKIECSCSNSIHIEAPMLSHFNLKLGPMFALTAEKFENLKTVCLDCFYIGSLLSKFLITKTVQNLTLDSGKKLTRQGKDAKLTLGTVFTVFPNVTSLCIKSSVWSELEACSNPQGWEILDGRKGLKTICAYLMLVNPSLTFSFVACVLDQCEGLLDVSLLIHGDCVTSKSKSFMSKCVARWPGLKWQWGIWSKGKKDTWITNAISN